MTSTSWLRAALAARGRRCSSRWDEGVVCVALDNLSAAASGCQRSLCAGNKCCVSVMPPAAQYWCWLHTHGGAQRRLPRLDQHLQHSRNSSSASMASESSAGTADIIHPSARSASSTSINQYYLPAQASAAAVAVLQLITSSVPSAKLLSTVGHEVAIKLPQDQSPAFSAMLHQLEASAAELGVANYGLSVTTLEEVFLAIADQAVALQPQAVRDGSRTEQHTSSIRDGTHAAPTCVVRGQRKQQQIPQQLPEEQQQQQQLPRSPGGHAAVARLAGPGLLLLQFKALFIKRVLCAR